MVDIPYELLTKRCQRASGDIRGGAQMKKATPNSMFETEGTW